PDIQAQLTQARENLQRLGNAVSELVNLSSDVFEDKGIKKSLEDLRKAYDEALQRLLNPTLSIATIGTTSSGKSTAVNALMGRSIAPIEADEMSGGVLTLRHSDERRLIIEATPDAAWETGEWKNLSDDELYNKIQTVMYRYHETRKKKNLIAPKIKVCVPLFPANELSLSGLPKGIGVEFLDLPGLKSVQDQANLKVIQPLVGKAFSIVVIDYTQIDEEHRQKLLGELKKVVEYLQGRIDSMIFVLNRVDRRTQKDKSIEERIAKLRVEIKDKLGLKELPDVLPLNALLLYYAQCAWGTNALNLDSDINQEVRSDLLKSLVKDCTNFIEDKTENNLDLDDWFTDFKKSVKRSKTIDDEQIRQFLNYALKWSGGEELWKCIKKRITESFSELVILPVLFDVFTKFDAFNNQLNLLIETRKIDNQEEVKLQTERIIA
ncbi:dynamin family protein, partial [Geminocystis sp. CENA526]|uniref:dynamin family protein n=1 Tax=Geminocystis sp. CENA526 TaxID=1355871 RepID=UPI003D6DB7D9